MALTYQDTEPDNKKDLEKNKNVSVFIIEDFSNISDLEDELDEELDLKQEDKLIDDSDYSDTDFEDSDFELEENELKSLNNVNYVRPDPIDEMED